MLRWPFGYDISELMFRVLFSSIFLGLGAEHLIDDRLIMGLMPAWVPAPRLASISAGLILLAGGSMVLLGWRLKRAAWLLGAFVIVVTLAVHVPGVLLPPPEGLADAEWLWVVLQRSNLVKNLCLLGVCVQLGWHRPGRFSIDCRRQRAAEAAGRSAGPAGTSSSE